MLILRSGITGIYDGKGNPPPSVKENTFKQLCYSLFASKVQDFIGTEEDGIKNFYEAVVKLNNKRIHILLNAHYPYMAYTDTRELYVDYFPFIANDQLADSFKPYYKVLSPSQLNEPLTFKRIKGKVSLENENTLSEIDLEQLVYWDAKTVGNVVFNYWD
ncbi:hypothetical protein [Alkalihalobacillus deserti]|uniref:hypothetical protein n=1 Tax=Alkalihalobacillus deserti TaxID=2879466 RepID=UPI001D142346|nr:hypothetical protein [Alkalihalobacillus deserti]